MDEDKVLIRSTLVSLNGCSLKDFSYEYEKLSGETPPYRKHKFATLLDYLKAMPDIVEITEDRGNVMLKAVNSQDISHIQYMVSRQKKLPSKTKNRKQYSRFSTDTNNPFSSSKRVFLKPNYSTTKSYGEKLFPCFQPTQPSYPTHCSTYPVASSSVRTSRQPPEPVSVKTCIQLTQPVKVRPCRQPTEHEISNITKLFKEFPTGMWLSRFLDNYKNCFDKTLDIGYDHLPTFLENIQNVEICKQDGHEKIFFNDSQNKLQSFLQQDNKQSQIKDSNQRTKEKREIESEMFNSKIEKNIIKVLKSHPEGIWSRKFLAEYKETIKAELDLRSIGVSHLFELINRCNDIFGVEDHHNPSGDVLLYYKGGIKPSEIFDDLKPNDRNAKLNNLKNKIQQLVTNEPKGIPLKDLEDQFFEQFKEDLPWVQLGYQNLNLLVEEMEADQMLTIRKSPSIGHVLMKYGPPPGRRSLTPTTQPPPPQWGGGDRMKAQVAATCSESTLNFVQCGKSAGAAPAEIESASEESDENCEEWVDDDQSRWMSNNLEDDMGPQQRQQEEPPPKWGGGDQFKARLEAASKQAWQQDVQQNYNQAEESANDPEIAGERRQGKKKAWNSCNQENETFGNQIIEQQKVMLPGDIVYTHAFGAEQLPEDLTIWQPAYISHVYSPSHLYLQLGGKNIMAFRMLEEQIQTFYDSPEAQRYILPPNLLEGQVVCIAPYGRNRKWHRVFIREVVDNEDVVQAFYIDYGTVETLGKKELRLIKKEFLHLPAQAIKCQILGIEPLSSKDWAGEVTGWITENATINEVKVKFQSPPEKLLDKTSVVGIYDVDLGGQISLKAELVRNQFARHVEEEMEEFDENLVVQLPDLKEQLGSNEQDCIKDSEEIYISSLIPYKRIKRICLGDDLYPFHLIYFNFQLYMTYQELASLFYKIQSLKKTLAIKELRLPLCLLREDKDAVIFEHMKRFHIPDVSGDREHTKVITLYPIKSVMVMLYVMGHPQCKLIGQTLMDEYADLDSPRNYWQDPHSVEDLAKVDYAPPKADDNISRLCLMELIGILGALRQERIKLVSSMLPATDKNNARLAGQLDQVEKLLKETLRTLCQLEKDCEEVHRYAVGLFKK